MQDVAPCQLSIRGSDGLRALARVDLSRGSVRPYAIGGLGGLLFQFRDAPNAGVGTMVLGVGAEARFAGGWRAFGEGSPSPPPKQ